jgi:hypothetical protein
MGVGGQRHAPAALSRERDPVPIVQEAGWAPGPVWTAAKYLAPTGIRSPDRPVRSESLYRLRYPGPFYWQVFRLNTAILLKMQNIYITSNKLGNMARMVIT